jgi:hypothetical protein
MIDEMANSFFNSLKSVLWRETMFEDVQYYYCENELYALRLKQGTRHERIVLVKARSFDEAISLGVMER